MAPASAGRLSSDFPEAWSSAQLRTCQPRFRPLAVFEDAQASDVTPEAIQRVLADVAGQAWRHDILRTLRMVYRFGQANRLVKANPASLVRTHRPVRGERILPLSPGEVDRVAGEAGRWGAMILFMADSGARPGEAVMLEWRHVDLDAGTVELPGVKTRVGVADGASRHARHGRDPPGAPRVADTARLPHRRQAGFVRLLPPRGLASRAALGGLRRERRTTCATPTRSTTCRRACR